MIHFPAVITVAGLGALASGSNVNPTRRKAAELSAFFERLRQCLDERDMSQADLARELGVGVATVSEWFTRGRVPSGEVILRLPDALQVSGHWLLTGRGPRGLERRRGPDPYLRGVQDALRYVSQSLEEGARRFGAGRALESPPEAEVPPSAGSNPQP